jgi:hypothetical protein
VRWGGGGGDKELDSAREVSNPGGGVGGAGGALILNDTCLPTTVIQSTKQPMSHRP